MKDKELKAQMWHLLKLRGVTLTAHLRDRLTVEEMTELVKITRRAAGNGQEEGR